MRTPIVVAAVFGISLLGRGAEAACYATYTPGYIANAGRGDLVFQQSNDPSNLVSRIMQDMGLQRTHVGMMTDAGHVRHNTRSMSNPATSGTFNRTLDPNWLQNGTPYDGLQTAYSDHFAGSATTTIFNSRNWGNTYAAAQRLEQMQLRYSLYAFTSEASAYATGGDMCAGSILEASQAAPYGFSNVYFSDYSRAPIAWSVYNDIVNYINSNYPTGFFGVNPTGVAAQVVNCFAFNHCADVWSTGWTWVMNAPGQYIRPGLSIRPDDIVAQVQQQYASGVGNYYPWEQSAQIVYGYYDYDECDSLGL